MKSIFRVTAAWLGVAVFAASGPGFSAAPPFDPDGSKSPASPAEADLGADSPNKRPAKGDGDAGSTPAAPDPASNGSPASPTPDSNRYLTVFNGNNAERTLKLGTKFRQTGLTGPMPRASRAAHGDAPLPVRVIPEGPLDRSVSPRMGPIQRHAPPRR